jgi:hypothetical protein
VDAQACFITSTLEKTGATCAIFIAITSLPRQPATVPLNKGEW